ncbi:MAG: glycosyltransferase family 4 protein [Candidatus Marinimicrobia bacterium]|nr:glycosyltransferase family 4 protein [Candidatus Neomarinimicrobiota bacterium]
MLSLQNNGYKVHLLCSNKGKDLVYESWNGSTIHRLLKPGKSNFINSTLQLPVFLNLLWLIRSISLINKYDIKVVHVHDLPLTPIALYLKYFQKVKIIYDMHENYPAALRVWKKTGLEYWLKHPEVFKYIEQVIIPRFDRLIAVVDENRHRILGEYNVPEEKIYVVSNYVNLNTFVADTPYPDVLFPVDVKVFLYTGGLDVHRGIDITIEAFQKLSKNHDDILLLVVGGGKSAAGKRTELELRSLVDADPLFSEKVIITGWIDIKYIPWLIKQSDFCLLPQGANDHTNTTIPHKIFQYMSFGKPVIAADATPVKRFLAESGGGVTFISDDSENYHEVLEMVLNMDYAKMSYFAREKTKESYTWAIAERELLALYASLH